MTREERNDAIEFFKEVAEKEVDGARYSRLAIEALEQEPCKNVPDLYECPCGYGWDKNKVVRHHFCPNCGRAVDGSIKTGKEPCDDAISRSEALSAFRPRGITEDVWKECDVYKKLTALPPVTPQPKMGRWIPVSERLPEVGSEVLVCFDFKGKRSVYISSFYGDGEFHGLDDEYLTAEGRKYRKAVAWMPLPQPYKAESEVHDADSN